MKKLAWLAVLVVFLSGCSNTSREIERGMALRSKLLKASSCSFDAEITADYGDKLYIFSMACQGDSRGDLTFQVTAPETIAGITGTIRPKNGQLTFDDTALQFDLMADGRISPVSAPWVFLQTLRGGYLTSAGTEEGLVRLTLDDSYEDDALHVDIWLDDQDLPARAEILHGGRKILSLGVKSFLIV